MRERERKQDALVSICLDRGKREKPQNGSEKKKAVISARCPPPPKQHHRRRTNVVRVQKHYAFHPNPRVPFAFHLREKAKLASSFLRKPNCLSHSCESESSKDTAQIYAKRKRENNKRFIFANARSPLSPRFARERDSFARFERAEV